MRYNIYDKDSLQITMLCGLLLSGVDQHVDDEETEICFRYLDRHWSADFGRQTQFMEQIEQQRRKIVKEPAEYFPKMERLSYYINEHFSDEQKKAFLGFLNEVMTFDGLVDPHEANFVNIFQKHISVL